MITVEILRQDRDKAQVAFQEFALFTRKFARHLFCFFEGKDNPYYVPRIKRFTEKYHIIRCGGKDKVLKVHQLITNRPEYNHYQKAFFIDKDFDAPLASVLPPIFETPCYSIENLYVSSDVFSEILTNEFHLSKVTDGTTFEHCMTLFEARQQQFHQAICLFNAWYACLIDMRKASGQQTGVQLSEKLPKEWVDISLQTVSALYTLETLKEKFPNALTIQIDILNEKLILFQNCDACKVFRGKYEMQFLLTFISLLLQDANKSKKIFQRKIKFAFGDTISTQNALNIFSAYAETPERLLDYLKHVTQ